MTEVNLPTVDSRQIAVMASKMQGIGQCKQESEFIGIFERSIESVKQITNRFSTE